MPFNNKPLRLQIYLFILAVPLNLFWEVAQIRAYDFPESSLMQDIIGCFVPSLGDGLMTLIIFWIGWAVFRDSQWILTLGVRGHLFMMSMGLQRANDHNPDPRSWSFTCPADGCAAAGYSCSRPKNMERAELTRPFKAVIHDVKNRMNGFPVWPSSAY